MASWDTQHRLRLRAERALALLQQLWGDEPPPGPNSSLTALLDAIAGDDDNARQDHLVSHGDGLSYELLADLLQRDRPSQGGGPGPTAGPSAASSPTLPPDLVERLSSLGLFDPPASTSPRTGQHATGVWELDPTTGVVAYDDVSARLIGAGATAGWAPVESHLRTLIHPEDCEHVAQGMLQCLDSGAPYLVRFRTLSPEGKTVWLVSQGRVLHHPADSSPRLTGFITRDAHRTAPR